MLLTQHKGHGAIGQVTLTYMYRSIFQDEHASMHA